jgi:hypothetical protein
MTRTLSNTKETLGDVGQCWENITKHWNYFSLGNKGMIGKSNNVEKMFKNTKQLERDIKGCWATLGDIKKNL